MKNYTAFKYQLKPTEEQEAVLVLWVGSSRWIWNWCLSKNIKQYSEDKTFTFKYDLKKQVTQLKKEEEFLWLSEVPSQALHNRVIDFDTALKSVWKSGFGFPSFRSRHKEHHNTIRIDQTGRHIKPRKDFVVIPKMGKIKWVKHRNLEGKLKNITIKKENGKLLCICLCELPEQTAKKQPTEDNTVGIDLGIKDFVVTSDGEVVPPLNALRSSELIIKKKQRQLSKKQKGSANREKARKALNKAHYKIKCQRLDFTHKLSTQITNEYDFVACENLNVTGMKKNRKLAKSISDQGWSIFVAQLVYKSQRNGVDTIKIDRFAPSTKTCSYCCCKKDMPLDKRVYVCDNCGLEIDRDLNAAINIKRWGLTQLYRIPGC